MALSLPGERSIVSAAPFHPIAAFVRWIAAAQAARARRAALRELLDLDSVRLADLGISRDDVLAALSAPSRHAASLNAARVRNTRRA